ncbi:MAG TPA: phosphoglycerate dehydrogenase [Pirellulales bacterium]|nr:phosphoglycerate dehydrogenase [Pirellulales bacterium]
MPRILITSPILQHAPGPYRDLLETAGMEVVYLPQGAKLFEPASLIRLLDGIDGTLATVEPYSREVIAATRLRAIARHGVGYDAIDVAAATDHGVAVVIAAGTNHDCVAEQTVALLLAVFRGVPARDRSMRARKWERSRLLPRLAGRTLGIVGLGRIGRALAPRAIGLGLNVIAHDPVAEAASTAKLGVRLVPLDTLLATADIVSLHCPVTPQTALMINAQSLERMKAGSVLLNTSRGGLVDETALVAALKSGHLFGAGLDVFQQEPPQPDNPMLDLENVVLCPHMAGLDDESVVAMATRAAEGLVALYQNRWPEGCVVNNEIRPRWKW